MPQTCIEIGKPGQTLRGTAYLPDGAGRPGRVPTVLMLHGFTGHRIGNAFMFVNLARALNRIGIAAVAFDFLNSGESDGSFEQTRVTQQVANAKAMTRWLGGQGFVDRSRMAVLGHSLGALVACCLTARDPSYAARVLLAPTTVDRLCRYAGEPQAGDRVTIGTHALHAEFFTDVRTLDPLGDAARSPLPTLIVEGAADDLVPAAVSGEYADALVGTAHPPTVQRIADADHAFSRPQPRRELIDAVTEYLGRRLAG